MSIELNIPAVTIRAALLHAAKKDIRFYLNGVLIETTTAGCFVVATDGHRMFVQALPGVTCGGSAQFIVPRELLDGVKAAHDTVRVTIDGKACSVQCLGGKGPAPQLSGLLVDGRFPDWRRVVPAGKQDCTDVAAFNQDYVHDAAVALAMLAHSRSPELHIAYRGDDATVFSRADVPDAFVVIMPIHKKTSSAGDGVAPESVLALV